MLPLLDSDFYVVCVSYDGFDETEQTVFPDLDQDYQMAAKLKTAIITPLQKDISRPETTIHCFYAVKMGEKYLQRYRMHFNKPDIRWHDMQHEELLIVHPGQWVEEIRACCSQ